METNDERTLKTRTSRRILPLDVLLEPNELERLADRARHRQTACVTDAEAWLFGPELAVSPPNCRPVERRLDALLQAASGSARASHNHLRHAFASYLLATLLLPQDVDEPAVPTRLASVISPERFRRVADRLLGQQRLGAGALHAVSQLMGHTGPETTILNYCHLFELSLGLHCSRPATMMPIDGNWLTAALGVTTDARRKARSRSGPQATPVGDTEQAGRPTAAAVRAFIPGAEQMVADRHLLAAGIKRLGRDLARTWAAEMLEVEAPRRREMAGTVCARATVPAGKRLDGGWVVQWQRVLADHHDGDLRATAPKTAELARFVDQRLRLVRSPRADEIEALRRVVSGFRRRHVIQLRRLGNAEAFVRLLGAMGFQQAEVSLSLTSRRAFRMRSADIHRFLRDRSVAPWLAGRGGWRGSLVVRLRPGGLDQPILAARACRFVLAVLLVGSTATGGRGSSAAPT